MTELPGTPLSRRALIGGALAIGSATALVPKIAFAQAAGDRNLLFVLLRGAMDGMAMLAPLGDPAYNAARAQALSDYEGARKLDSLFTLHPAMQQIGKAYTRNEALFIHATATSYRDRSHFDGQDLLESGAAKPNTMRDGWLNRLVGLIGQADGSPLAVPPKALAISPTIPLALRGDAPASNYAPSSLPEASADFIERVSLLYKNDPELGELWSSALETRAMAADDGLRNLRDAAKTGKLIASLMRGETGARISMVELSGWDTHANQRGNFRRSASALDTMLGAYQTAMGSAWDKTAVIVATEFGRTVSYNGTRGTDHGTASATMLMGGAVKGGRILGNWPGMAKANLYRGRDLMPTTSLESIIAGATAQHFGLDPMAVQARLFPERTSRPMEGLIRA
ncbi:MAG: DUF1501 domain-containing protein [Pseudomonadota bacterium]|nr:DUF1501 domain-containing protein [Pseudomonadota bacterium]